MGFGVCVFCKCVLKLRYSEGLHGWNGWCLVDFDVHVFCRHVLRLRSSKRPR